MTVIVDARELEPRVTDLYRYIEQRPHRRFRSELGPGSRCAHARKFTD